MLVAVMLGIGLVADALAQSPCDSISDSARIYPIGRFSNLRYTGEHASGYDLQLWRAGVCVLGLFQVSEGLAADIPAGLITQIRYTPATGQLDFRSKLTVGVTSLPGSTDWIPTRDLYVFSGRLSGNQINGKLEHSDQLLTERSRSVSEIVLLRSVEEDGLWSQAKTYGAWRKTAETILKFRGPKW
jgi:hypothetical protein